MSLPLQTLVAGTILAWCGHRGWRLWRNGADAMPGRDRANLLADLIAAGLVALRMVLGRAVPLYAIPAAPFDDRLFLRQATQIAEQGWLGPYDSVLLTKGPGFALFWAWAHELGVSLVNAQNLALGVAAWLMVVALRQGGRGYAVWWQVLALALLLFVPIGAEAGVMVRAWRQAWWTALVVGTLAASIGFTLAPPRGWARWVWAGLTGLGLGWAWITREEAVWLLAPIGLLVGFATWQGRRTWRMEWGSLVLVVALPIVVVQAVAGLNRRHLDFDGVVEFKDPAFERAYGALTRVEPHDLERRVVVTRAARERIYAVSPAFAAIREELEHGVGAAFMQVTQDNLGIPKEEAEIGGGWFVWALRESAWNSGGAGSAAEARAFYTQLADEVEAAFARGELTGEAPRATLSPVLRWDVHGSRFLSAWWRGIALHFTYRINPGPIPSVGSPDDLAWVARVAGQSVASPDPAIAQAQASAGKLRVWRWLDGVGYRWVVHPLAALAAAGLLLVGLWQGVRGCWTGPTVAGLAVIGAILANAAVVGLVDATSWNAVGLGYLGATMALVPVPLVLVLRRGAEHAVTSPPAPATTPAHD